ncbi:MAG: N-acetylglucosamine-6-phosphate deacetylase [Cyanophyceae cyanobacterium]
MCALDIINARLPHYEGLQQIKINDQGIIETIKPFNPASGAEIAALDVSGDWLSLGGIDLQINGGLGLAFPDLEERHLPMLAKICEFLWQQGVDGFLPTIVTTAADKIRRSLSTLAQFMAAQTSGAKVLGVHLEGPFLNPQKRGAHPEKSLLPLTIDNLKRVLGGYAQIVKVITLAPELDPTGDAITYLRALGMTVSLGHSLATAQEAKQAFAQGASMVTHAFNAMPPLHHRQPGLLGEAIVSNDVYCGLIADGQHVHPTMLTLLLRASHYSNGIFLVSDALAPIGLADGFYPWDERQIEVRNGTARLADGTLAGTTLPLLTGVENLVRWGCGVGEAIALATESPRKAIGLPGLSPGQLAKFLRWHWDEEKTKLIWRRWSSNTS